MQETRMHLTDWYDDCRRLAALVARLGICLLGAGMVWWAEPVAAQDGGSAEPCRNGVVVPEPQDHPGLVADCAALLGALNQWVDSGLNWSAERPIRRWEDVWLSETANEVRVISLSPENHNLEELPPEIGRLSKLEHLDFSRNELKTIPPEIGQLIQLKSLDLRSNNMEMLPPEIGQLIQLRRLALHLNNLEELPPEIGQLPKLEYLTLWANELKTIPPQIGQLTQLETLVLSSNDLEELPPEIGQLAKLEYLSLSGNEFETIPPELSQLGNLRTLYINSCRLRGAILPDLGNLHQLEWLHLAGNFLSGAIPPELGQLALLEILNLSENDLTGQIPSDLGRMAALRKLDFSRNDLSGPIPPELGQLASLEGLNLSENDLTGQIPPDLGRMADLRVLYLSGNDLSGPIPPELGQLGWLQILDLSHNQLSGSLPPELAQLARLDSLDLSHNRLSGPLGRGLVKLFRQNPVVVDFTGNGMICVGDSPFAFGDVPPCEPPPPPEGRIYWTEPGTIRRADLDGSNIKSVIDGGGSPEGIALDPAAGKLYWTEWVGTGKIQRSDLDGSNLETLVTGVGHPRGIALDLEGEKIYFTTDKWFWDRRNSHVKIGKIWRANLDGSDAQVLLARDISGPNMDIALDSRGGQMYWTDGYSIERANLDGSDASDGWDLRVFAYTGTSSPDVNTLDIVLDAPGGRIYWVDVQGIHRAGLDSSNSETLVTLDGKPAPRSLALDLSGGRMYWTDSQVIYRADLDGSHAEPLLTAAEHPGGIAFDPIGGKVYWTEPEAERIRRVDRDGTHVETAVVARARRAPAGLALDRAGNRMYWTDRATNRIHRADLDGAHIEDLAGGLTAPGGIALDVPRGKMYWTNVDTSVIHRADLDGGNVENLAIPPGSDGITGIALDLSAGKIYWMDWRMENGEDLTVRIGRAGLAGTGAEVLLQYSDYTDGYESRTRVGGLALDPVGGKMYWVHRKHINTTHNNWVEDSLYRSNLDGSDTENLGVSMGSWGIAVDAIENRLYWSHGGSIHLSDLQGNQATLITGLSRVGTIALDVPRPATVSTFATVSCPPAATCLALNYPNPFNSGTRLVYRLADPGPVRLEVYNVLGQRVRTLVDEFRKAGSYQVHWDARDQGGTPAAAGVYVTRLQYPGGEQTRRLLLLK